MIKWNEKYKVTTYSLDVTWACINGVWCQVHRWYKCVTFKVPTLKIAHNHVSIWVKDRKHFKVTIQRIK